MENKKSLKDIINSWSFNKKFVVLFLSVILALIVAALVLALVPALKFSNWYGFLMGSAIVLCVLIGQFSAIKQGFYRDLVFDYAIMAVPYAFVGGIVYYAMFHDGDMGLGVLGSLIAAGISLLLGIFIYRNGVKKLIPSASSKVCNIINSVIFSIPFALLGGIAQTSMNGSNKLAFGPLGLILGAAAGIAVGLLLFTSNYEHPKTTILQMLDLCGVYFLLGQAIGRIGCYFGHCCYGIEVTFDFFPFSYVVNGSLHLGNPFIESIWCLLGCLIQASILLGKKKCFSGYFISFYCIWYGVERFILEFFRASEQKLVIFGDFGSSQLVSLIMVAFGIVYIAQYFIRAKLSGKKPLFMVDRDKLSDEYFEYGKTIYSNPHVTINGEKIEKDK